MGSRYNIPNDSLLKPGPGAHRPEKLNLGHIPCYSFGNLYAIKKYYKVTDHSQFFYIPGIRHSQYLGHFREVSA